MNIYLLSLAVGLLVGGFYAVVGVRAPAPPVVGLLGLFGIYCGEMAVRAVGSWFTGPTEAAAIGEKERAVPADCPSPTPIRPWKIRSEPGAPIDPAPAHRTLETRAGSDAGSR